MKNNRIKNLVLSGAALALCMVLPFLTGQIPQMGQALLPMHLPVLLCGFLCGPWYGAAVGLIAPLLRFALFGMPPLMPTGVSMCFELAAYGLVCGLCHKKFPHTLPFVYLSLTISLLSGRLVWGAMRTLLAGLGKSTFSWAFFMAGAFTNAVPGIILQFILIPVLVVTLEKALKKH